MIGRYGLRSLSQQTKVISTTKMSSDEVQTLKVHHDQDSMEFYIKLGNDKAFLQYDILDPVTEAVDLQHTVVPDVFRGQGIAKILAKEAMDHFAMQNKHMKLTCWYLKKYFKENPNPLYVNKVFNE